jgi:hypothetical protein
VPFLSSINGNNKFITDLISLKLFWLNCSLYISWSSKLKQNLQAIYFIICDVYFIINCYRFPNYKKKIKADVLFLWHYLLTGSCKTGRENFCKINNISLSDSFTILEFIKITKNSYGGDIIKQL